MATCSNCGGTGHNGRPFDWHSDASKGSIVASGEEYEACPACHGTGVEPAPAGPAPACPICGNPPLRCVCPMYDPRSNPPAPQAPAALAAKYAAVVEAARRVSLPLDAATYAAIVAALAELDGVSE